MRIMLVVIAVVLAIVIFVVSQANARQMSLEADGEVNIYSKSGNQRATTAVSIIGEGQVYYGNDSSIETASVRQGYTIELFSAENTRDKLVGIVSTEMTNGNGSLYRYALKISPNPATAAILDFQYNVGTEAFASLDISADVFVEEGLFRNYIDIYNPSVGKGLFEEIAVLGYVRYLDSISISEPETE